MRGQSPPKSPIITSGHVIGVSMPGTFIAVVVLVALYKNLAEAEKALGWTAQFIVFAPFVFMLALYWLQYAPWRRMSQFVSRSL